MRATGVFPAEGIALSQIWHEQGLPTGFSVLDDFLPWEGLPLSAITLLEGPYAGGLARKLISGHQYPQRSIWIHSMRQRPFFLERETCFRLQVPEEPDLLRVLPEVLQDTAFTTVIVQISQPLPRAKALALFELAKRSDISLILICKQMKIFPSELADLVIEANEDFLCIRKALHRPVPLWIPVEMLELSSGPDQRSVLSWQDAFESVPG